MARSLEQPVADPTYLEYFGLTRPPFAHLTEPSQLFQTEQYSLLMEHLVSARKHADSLVAICGADGSGKSTLLDYFVASLGDQISFVTIDETCPGEEQFYGEFLTQIGFEEISGTADELHNITKEFILHRGNAGDPVLLIIDNAHLINPIILEQLRRIAEIDVDGRRVLSAVLAGNADLVRIIDAPAMRQTKFHSHVVFNIRNYTEEETASYVWHRLRLAGPNDGVKFPDDTRALIHRYSGGIPHLINRLCDDSLAEACELESRVITEKIIRTVADKQRLLPHVAPLHGKGRRKTDADYEQVRVVPIVEEQTASAEPKAEESVETSTPVARDTDNTHLLQQVSLLSEQVDDLRADKKRVLQDIGERNKDISELRNALDSKITEIEKLTRQRHTDVEEITQQTLAVSQTTIALQDREDTSRKLVADLAEEARKRKVAENELAKATATVDDLSQLRQKLQATVDRLTADLQVADERAIEIESLNKSTTALKKEIYAKDGELESRNHDLADLEARLEESRNEYASAERRIAALENPEELQEIIKTSDKLAADLDEATRAREAVENELAKATATVDELSEQKQELQATVDGLKSELELAGDQAVKIEALEKNTAELGEKLEQKTGELDSLRDELDSRNKILADLETGLEESQKETASAERRIAALKSPEELQEVVKASDKLAADLENETRTREAAQNELAQATASVDELSEQKQELQATVDDLKSDLELAGNQADDQAAKIEGLAKNTAEFNQEIEKKTGELDSLRDELDLRNKILADLETRFEKSQSECELAQLRLKELKSPKELQEMEEASEKLAADLQEEARTREAAENELAKATATVDERAVEIEALEKNTVELRDELEKKTGELGAQQEELDSRNKALADLETRLEESQKEYASAERRIAALKSPEELQEVVDASEKLAADLAEETRTREAAEAELAKATATVDERALEIEALEKTTAELRDELEQSQKEYASAERRIAALKSPEELQEVVKVSDKLAADLAEETRTREAAENELAKAAATIDERAVEIEALEKTTAELRDELEQSQKEYASAERRIEALKSPEELQEVVKASDKLAADLAEETRTREAAEAELATATATVDERALEVEALEKTTAELRDELEQSQKEYASAERRIEALKSPEELQEVVKASDKLAADLAEETRTREAAEAELATATATVDELSQLKRELQATVSGLRADLEQAGERLGDYSVLEMSVTALKDQIEDKADELDLRGQAIAELEKRLEASQKECRSLRRRATASKDTEDTESEEVVTTSTQDSGIYSSHVVVRFEQSLRKVRAYQTLRKYDPTFYEGLLATYKKLIGLDHTDKQVNDALRAKQAQLIEKLLPKASDEAVISYARLVVDQLDEFLIDGAEPSFTLLIPKADPGKDESPVYSERTRKRELRALDITLRTHDAGRHLPTEEEVWPDLEPIFEELFEEYGQDNVSAIQDSYDPSVDRVQVCNISSSLYSKILGLPKRKAVKALRWILSP